MALLHIRHRRAPDHKPQPKTSDTLAGLSFDSHETVKETAAAYRHVERSQLRAVGTPNIEHLTQRAEQLNCLSESLCSFLESRLGPFWTRPTFIKRGVATDY